MGAGILSGREVFAVQAAMARACWTSQALVREERQDATVFQCRWIPSGWVVALCGAISRS